MQNITTKLEASRERLVQQGTAFFQQSSGAAESFFEKTRKAGRKFGEDTRKAGQAFATTTTVASRELVTGIRAEAETWRTTLLASVPTPVIASDASGSHLASPKALERELLLQVEQLLGRIVGRVHSRVELLDTLVGPQLPAEVPSTVAAKNATKNGAEHGALVAPFTNYDELSAKEIVARLERMSDEKTAAVHAYELATKKRATVLRAAEVRLAAEA